MERTLYIYSTYGNRYQQLSSKAIDGSYLPPWDRPLRVGLVAKGDVNEKATFDRFDPDNK